MTKIREGEDLKNKDCHIVLLDNEEFNELFYNKFVSDGYYCTKIDALNKTYICGTRIYCEKDKDFTKVLNSTLKSLYEITNIRCLFQETASYPSRDSSANLDKFFLTTYEKNISQQNEQDLNK